MKILANLPADLRKTMATRLRLLLREERQAISNRFSNAYASVYRGMGHCWLIVRVRPAFRRDERQYYAVPWGGSNDWDRRLNEQEFQALGRKDVIVRSLRETLRRLPLPQD